MTGDEAEMIALRGLGWLAGHETLLHRFLADAGLSAGDLRARAGEPVVLASVLDFVLTEDAMVLDLAAELGCGPHDIAAARAHLPGGRRVHWT